MAIVEDASSPAIASTSAATTVTTASFTPPAGSLILALVGSDGTAGVNTIIIMSDSLSGTWTLLKRTNVSTNGPPAVGGTAEIWVRDATNSPMTVTATQSGGTFVGMAMTVKVLTGAATRTAQTGVTGGVGGGSFPPATVTLTPGTGNRIYGVSIYWASATARTVNASTTKINEFLDTSNGDAYTTFKSSADTTGASVTVGYTNPVDPYNISVAEILAAGGGAAVAGGETISLS